MLIAHELMHSLHTKNLKSKFMALKLDVLKVFCKVEWNFIDKVMRQMSFTDQWWRWIYKCMSAISYSVLINGEPTKTINLREDLDREIQYLYIICTKGLSQLKIMQFISRNSMDIKHREEVQLYPIYFLLMILYFFLEQILKNVRP